MKLNIKFCAFLSISIFLLATSLNTNAALINFKAVPGQKPNSVDITAEGDTPIGFYVLDIVFSPSVLRAVSYTPTNAIGIPGVEQFGYANSGVGRIYAESVSSLPSHKLPLTATLATIQFEALMTGLAVVGFLSTVGGDLHIVPSTGVGTVIRAQAPVSTTILLIGVGLGVLINLNSFQRRLKKF